MSQPLPFLSPEQLVEVFNHTKNPTAIHVTEDAIIQTANDAMLQVWGKDRSVIGTSLAEFLSEVNGQPFLEIFKRVWAEGLTLSGLDTPADLNINGEIKTVYFDFEYRPIKDANGTTICVLHTAMDVTDRFMGKEELIRILEKDEAFSREHSLNEKLATANEELASLNQEYQQIQESLTELNDDLEKRIELRTQDLEDLVVREQKLNEELQRANIEFRYSEEKLNDILQELPSPVVILRGPQQIIEITNQAILNFWNKKHDEVTGKPMLEVFPELRTQVFPELWKHVLEKGEPVIKKEMPVNFRQANGELKLSYVDFYYQPLSDLNGNNTGVLATVIDVTHKVDVRKQLEENQGVLLSLNDELSTINEEMTASNEELLSTNAELALLKDRLYNKINKLAESESRFRSLVEQSPVAIALFRTPELIIDIVNNQMLDIWGKTSDIEGKPLAVAMPELLGQPFIPIMEGVFTTGETYYGYENKGTVIRDDKPTEGYFNFICQPIKDVNGNINFVLQVVSDITEQVKARLDLQKTEEMMRFAVDAAKLGVWHIQPKTKALKYNVTLAKIFGYEGEQEMTYEQAIGQVTEEYREVIVEEIQKAIADAGDYDITYSQRRFNDGELIWLRSLGKVNQDEKGYVTFSGFIMDVTEHKKDEDRKNDFIGMVSHELKTPLTSLSGYLQILQSKAKKANDSFTIGALEVAGKQVKKMTSMINGFLNISRLESGKIILNKSSFKLNELIKDTVEEVIILDTSHIITFSELDEIEIFADYDKISNVMSNLLSNAVKYAPDDKQIEVSCKIVDGAAQIGVKDQGMGIDKKDVEKLFERYYRVENNHTISGFGIGLYLGAEIIERHNGKIWAESELGKGSTFYFNIPLI